MRDWNRLMSRRKDIRGPGIQIEWIRVQATAFFLSLRKCDKKKISFKALKFDLYTLIKVKYSVFSYKVLVIVESVGNTEAVFFLFFHSSADVQTHFQ